MTPQFTNFNKPGKAQIHMNKAFRLENDIIILDREFTELDLFVKQFIDVLSRHNSYLIVSGYVSISTGRTRATEDVDVLVPVMDEKAFISLFEDLTSRGFWCYQSDSALKAYEHATEMLHLRFARKNEIFPNIEFIPVDASKKLQHFELANPQKIKVGDFMFLIPKIEFEILYKEKVLKSEKDIADARHLRTFFSDILSGERFKKFEALFRQYEKY